MKKLAVTATSVVLTVALSACAHNANRTDTSDMERPGTVSTYNTTGPAVGAEGASTSVIVHQTVPADERNGSAPMTTQDTLSRNQRPTSTGNIESTTARINTENLTTTTTVPAPVTSSNTVINTDMQPTPAPAPMVMPAPAPTPVASLDTTTTTETPAMSSSTTETTTTTTSDDNDDNTNKTTKTHRRHHRKD